MVHYTFIHDDDDEENILNVKLYDIRKDSPLFWNIQQAAAAPPPNDLI